LEGFNRAPQGGGRYLVPILHPSPDIELISLRAPRRLGKRRAADLGSGREDRNHCEHQARCDGPTPGDSQLLAGGFDALHRCSKTVARFRQRLDVALTERLPQQKDILSKAVFHNRGIGPERLDQFFFGNHTTVVLYKHEQRVQNLRCEGYALATTSQDALAGVEMERTKSIQTHRLAIDETMIRK